MKIAVLGAGISGLSVARLLQERGHEVTIYEKNDRPGGLARSRFVNGYLYDPYGGHIFNSKHPQVVDWVFSLLPRDKWVHSARNAKIYLDGKFISYPFELSLCELPLETRLDCALDFLRDSERGAEPDNFRDWLIWKFGAGIAENYMLPYNEKIWSYPLDDMETSWMQGKMPLPEPRDLLTSLLLSDPTERKMPHSTFYYPLEGGIQSLMDAVAHGLNLKLNTPVSSISRSTAQPGWQVNKEGPYDKIISTIPLPELPEIMELPGDIANKMKGLKYNSLTTVLFSFPKNTDISWLYIPSRQYRAHRVGFQSALTPQACPSPSTANQHPDLGCGALEIIGPRFEVGSEFASRTDVLPAELGFTKVLDSAFAPYAYVIHDKAMRGRLDAIQEYLAALPGFITHGRWGLWNYKNMDLCILDSMHLCERLS